RTPMNLQSLEELLIKSFDMKGLRERSGIPHPLAEFAANGSINDGPCADAILGFVHDLAMEEPSSPKQKNAVRFLLESDKAFFFACSEAGIDAEKLRKHLVRWRSGVRFSDEEHAKKNALSLSRRNRTAFFCFGELGS